MNITVNRMELLSAAQAAERIAPSVTALDILECAYLAAENDSLVIASGNLEVALERRIPATVHEDGEAVVSAKLLAGMLRLLDGDTVSIRRAATGIATVSGGAATYSLQTKDPRVFPRMELPFPEDTVAVTGIPAMAKRTVFAASESSEKPLMRCVQLRFTSDGLKAVVSDGQRIASAKGDDKSTGDVELLLPASSLDKLAQLVDNRDALRVGTTGKHIVFSKDNFLFSARLMEGRYFDSDQLLSRVRPAFTVLTDAAALRSVIHTASAASGSKNRFCLRFDGCTLKARCESEFGVSQSELEVVALSGTPSGEYWYPWDKLLECLRAQNGTMMLDVVQNGALVMRTDELLCMQMALRKPGPVEIVPRKPVEAAPPPKPKQKQKQAKPKKTKAVEGPAAA